MKRRIIFSIALTLIICTLCMTGMAAEQFDSFNSLPAGWSVSVSGEATGAYVAAEDGVLRLSYDTENAIGKAEVTTGENAYDQKLIYMSMVFSYSGSDDKCIRSVSIVGENAFYSDSLFELKGSTMTFFGTEQGCAVASGQQVDVSVTINLSDSDNICAVAEVNGEEKFNGPISLHRYIDLSKVKFKISNRTTGRITQHGTMDIYSFKTEASNELPSISFDSQQRTEYKEGENISLTANVAGNFDRIIFYSNDEEIGSFASSPAACDMRSEPGRYEVYAAAKIGALTVQTEKIIVTVEENTAPQVSFKDYRESANIEYGTASSLEILAEDEDGIFEVEVYVNGRLSQTLASAPYLVSLENMGIGENVISARAVDSYGKSAECTLTVSISKYMENEFLWESEFTDYSSLTSFSSGITMTPQRGYVNVDKVDDEHGLSLLVGIDTANTSYKETDAPFAVIDVSSLKNFVVECDFYTDKIEASGRKNFAFRTSTGGHIYFLRLSSQLEIGPSGNVKLDYDAKTWYHFKLEVDVSTNTPKMNFYLGKEGEELKPVLMGTTINSNLSNMGVLRIYGPTSDEIPTYTAVDNISVKSRTEIPQIVRVNDGGDIPAGTESVTAYLNGALYGASISADTVSVTDELGNGIELAAAVWNRADNSIQITPKGALKSDMKYFITISETARLNEMTEIGAKLTAGFKTAREGIGVSNCEFAYEKECLTVSAECYNTRDVVFGGYLVMTVWDNGKYCGKEIQRVDIAASGSVEVSLTHSIPERGTAELYLYDSLSAPRMMANRVYIYSR